MWAIVFLGFICVGFFHSPTELNCPSPFTTKNEDKGRLLRKITCPKSQQFGDLLIPSPWSQPSKTLWQCFTGLCPWTARHKERLCNPGSIRTVQQLLGNWLHITSLLTPSWGKFYNKSWLCATLSGQTGSCGDGTGDASVICVLANSKLGMCWGLSGILSLLFTLSITHCALGNFCSTLSGNQTMSGFQK